MESGFSFSPDVIAKALKNIYAQKFDPLTDIEENLFDETWKNFNTAVDKGVSFSGYNPGDDFIRELKYNNAVFSAFRTHRMQNDIAAQLLDADGKLKPFGKFVKDVAPIADHHVKHWMQTEYNTAVIRAHRAADWKRFDAEKDILPNLEWIPTTSVTPAKITVYFGESSDLWKTNFGMNTDPATDGTASADYKPPINRLLPW